MRVSFSELWKKSASPTERWGFDWAESDLCSSGRWGKTDSPATWSHPDLSEPVTGQDSDIKMGVCKGWKSWTV